MSSLRNRTAALTALAAAFVLGIAGCGSAGGGGGEPTTSPTVNHRANLAPRESVDLASQLVQIRGYSYVDPSVSEVNYLIKRVKQLEERLRAPGFIAAQSYHAVVAADASQNKSHTASGGTEVGFLQLYAYSQAPPASLTDDVTFFSSQQDGKAPITRLEISGTPVYVFEHPDLPNSRFQYMWLRHGILANFDGAARGPLERWLNLYLTVPNPSPPEDAQLAARLVPVAGYAYVNLPDPAIAERTVRNVFGAAAYSLHEIVNGNGSFANLALVSVPAGTTTAAAVADYHKAYPELFGSPASSTIAGVTVEKFNMGEGVTTYVWAAKGVAGSMSTNDTAAAEQFLRGLLSGWKLHRWT